MSKSTERDEFDQKNYIIWSFIGVTLMTMLSFILPFPAYFILSLLAILCGYFITTERNCINLGLIRIKKLYHSHSSAKFGAGMNNKANNSYQSIIFFCMNCGNQHDEIACPKCGSKAVKAN